MNAGEEDIRESSSPYRVSGARRLEYKSKRIIFPPPSFSLSLLPLFPPSLLMCPGSCFFFSLFLLLLLARSKRPPLLSSRFLLSLAAVVYGGTDTVVLCMAVAAASPSSPRRMRMSKCFRKGGRGKGEEAKRCTMEKKGRRKKWVLLFAPCTCTGRARELLLMVMVIGGRRNPLNQNGRSSSPFLSRRGSRNVLQKKHHHQQERTLCN